MKSRIVTFVILMLLGFAGLVGRLFYLQVLPNDNLTKLEKKLYSTVVSVPPRRGVIVDRNGQELASTISNQSLFADPSLIKNPRRIARRLSKHLRMSRRNILRKLKKETKFVWIKRHLSREKASRIKEWNVRGLGFIEEPKRAYPNGRLLSHVLGFVGIEGRGLGGLEKKYDGELQGAKKSFRSRRDARGRPLFIGGKLFHVTSDGATLHTTIDQDLQFELEKNLKSAVKEQEAKGAVGVILSPKTGEILAMGSYPDFNPSRATKVKSFKRRNKPITDIFEPGSTFKVVTVAAALRSQKFKPNSKVFCENGKFKIGRRTIRESDANHKFGWLTLSEILEVSSNIGTTKLAFEVGQKDFLETIESFGFTKPTGVDFPGEAKGLISRGRWKPHLLSNISFGHGIGVTALQVANAYGAIANGGNLMKPYLVNRIVDSNGETVFQRQPEIKNRVLSKKQAQMLTFMLTGATEAGGTGAPARIAGYPVAGKTGTAQKVDPEGRGYLKGAYLSSFAGYVPANDPQFVIYVMVDSPQKAYYGSKVAAPIFHKLASFALKKKVLLPVVVPDKEWEVPFAEVHMDPKIEDFKGDHMPNLKGLTMREVAEKLSRYKGELEFTGSGVAVLQHPKGGEALESGQEIKVFFRNEP